MYVERKREGTTPKKSWLDVIESGVRTAGISVKDAGDRVK